jgi:endogenous inhibitor of DNA gyrase (YacG/DUF329 family)
MKKLCFTCQQCGVIFSPKTYNYEKVYKFCSQKCVHESQRKSITKKCLYCGNEFVAKQSRINKGFSKFCSKQCARDYQKLQRITVICKTCKKEFSVIPSTIKFGGGIFCSKECSYLDKIKPEKYESEQLRRLRLRSNFIEWRNSVYKRDNWKCRKCGKTHTKIHAHHIIPVSADKTLMYEVSNGITLCQKCHRIEHLRMSQKNNLQIDIFEVRRTIKKSIPIIKE